MIIFFKTRSQARQFAQANSNGIKSSRKAGSVKSEKGWSVSLKR